MRICDWGSDVCSSDLFGDLGADHMRAEQFAGLRVEDGLGEALGLAQRNRLAVADEGEGPGLPFVTQLLRLRFGQPRSDERWLGKECVRTFISSRSPSL